MTTMLANFPVVSQLTKVTPDGLPSTNGQMDCVAASVDAVCRWLLNQPENTVFDPENFKDEAYGKAYTGGTAATRYIAYCKTLGVDLYSVDCSSPEEVIAQTRQLLLQNKPAIFTQIDPYVDTNLPQYADWTHVCVFDGYDSAGLVAMDPYVAQNQYKSDATWMARLRSNQLWTAERVAMMITIHTPGVSDYFEENSDGSWTCKKYGTLLYGDILKFYCSYGGSGLCGLTYLGLPLTGPESLDNDSNKIQFFERGCLVFDPKHKYDFPPGAGSVYLAHVYGSGALGLDPHIPQLQQQITQLQQQLQQANSTNGTKSLAQTIQTTIAPFLA